MLVVLTHGEYLLHLHKKNKTKKKLFQPNIDICLPYLSSLLVKLEGLALIILQYDILKTEHLDQAIQQVCLLFGYPMK